jgi:K+-sensing histidine kinase KdpD
LIGMQQLILSDLCDSPEEEREFLAQANESALKMVKVLDDILEVSKIEHGTTKLAIQPIQIAQALQDIQILTQMQAKNRNLHLTLLPIEPEIYGLADPRWLRQVLLHLVDGAISQMEEGSITMSAAADAESGYVHIWIDDNRQIADWSEAIHFLQSAPDPNLSLPTPGLNLLLDQTLLQLMQGKLELLPSAIAENPTGTRIQCSIPLSPLEE